MEKKKFDILQLAMQPYVLTLLNALDKPTRFNDLVKLVRSRRTLTIKLNKLMKQGLIEYHPLKTDDGYVNSYVISDKGKEVVKKLDRLKV